MKTRFAGAGLFLAFLITAGCGAGASSAGNNSGGTNWVPAFERADNLLGRTRQLLGKTQDAGGAAQTELTPRSFAALTKARGFTVAVAAEVASRVRVDAVAARRTVGRTHAAARDARRADKILVLVAAEQQEGGRVENGTLALGMDDIATNEIAYQKKLQQQAVLLEQFAPLFMAAAAALPAWQHQDRTGAFPTRKAATVEYRRRVDRPLSKGLRLLSSANLLQREVARAHRSLRNSIVTLAVLLRRDSSARQQARHLSKADPQGFLASGLKSSG